jgi:hypothetical protein
VTWAQLAALGRTLPGVELGTWYGTPALKVSGKGFVRLKEDGASVVFLTESVDEQQFLLQAMPKVYFLTPHYEGWPAVLARLKPLSERVARQQLQRSWAVKAPPSTSAKAKAPRTRARGRAVPTTARRRS